MPGPVILLCRATPCTLLRQRVYQVAAGYEDCNDANHLRVDPVLRLSLGKEHESGAGQSALCRFENKILATREGLKALENALSRSADSCAYRHQSHTSQKNLDPACDV